MFIRNGTLVGHRQPFARGLVDDGAVADRPLEQASRAVHESGAIMREERESKRSSESQRKVSAGNRRFVSAGTDPPSARVVGVYSQRARGDRMSQLSVELLSLGSAFMVVLFALTDREARRRSRRVPRGAVERHPSLYELAYLAGGPRRVVVTGLAALVRAKAVRLGGDGHVEVLAAGRGTNAVEHAAMTTLASRDGRLTVGELCAEMYGGAAIADLPERLVRQRLLLPAGYSAPGWSRRLLRLSTGIASAVVVLAAFERQPLSAVIALVAVVIGEVVWRVARANGRVPLTDAGHFVLARTLTRYKEGNLRGMPDVAVALRGGSAAGDLEVRRGLQTVDVIPLDADGSWAWKPARLPSTGADGGSGDHTGGLPYGAGSY
jgi:uncharacterized protein (TIGR04222 family)